ncbi:MAG: hypothetical protein HY820_41855 [Acidobacteria bacterium]|nr:hypothetical protein [Acidobacteriota bacterium]
MDRTGNAGFREALRSESGIAAWRIAAGIAVLLALAGFCGLLAQPYLDNWKLQTFVENVVKNPAVSQGAPEVIAASVANRAAQLGVPLRIDQIRVMKSASGVYIEARYAVRVDMLFYTVNLHFRPSAGMR